jgi:chromosome segregation ATPase
MKELGRAINALSQSRDAFSQGNPGRGKQAGEQAGEALDKAVISLRESAAACQKPGSGQSGKSGKSAREQMQSLAGQQDGLNGETQQMSERLSRQQRLAAGDQATLERLAAEQRAIRQGLEEALQTARPEDNLLGRMDAAEEEMKQVEERLRQGDLDAETLARQEKILSRMLDAQRSLNRRDFDDQRESRTGRTVPRPPPADLRAALLEREARARYDLLRAQAEKYPGEYRSLVEAYLRRLGENE